MELLQCLSVVPRERNDRLMKNETRYRRTSLPAPPTSTPTWTTSASMPRSARITTSAPRMTSMDPSPLDLTRRTLRPPSPTTLSRAHTPNRDLGGRHIEPMMVSTLSRRTSKPTFLPLTREADLDSPTLKDYLDKPRLVNTVGCGTINPKRYYPEAEERPRATSSQHRKLRLGGFMENKSNNADELIPDVLRQYYLDTYLSDSKFSSPPSRRKLSQTQFHRGM